MGLGSKVCSPVSCTTSSKCGHIVSTLTLTWHTHAHCTGTTDHKVSTGREQHLYKYLHNQEQHRCPSPVPLFQMVRTDVHSNTYSYTHFSRSWSSTWNLPNTWPQVPLSSSCSHVDLQAMGISWSYSSSSCSDLLSYLLACPS